MQGCTARTSRGKNMKIGVVVYNQTDTFLGELLQLFQKDVDGLRRDGEETAVLIRDAAGSQRTELSIDEPLNTDWDGNELLLSDILGTDEDEVCRPLEDDAERRVLLEAVERLEGREREIIRLRFGLDGQREYTQKEVADMLGISQSYISRLEKRILTRLRREMLRLLQV